MTTWFNALITQIAATSLAEWVAVVLAIAYVVLAAKESVWCWLCAFVSTAIYTWLFWQVSLPFQSALNVFYMVMAGYGYYQWRGKRQNEAMSIIHRWRWQNHVICISAGTFVATLLANFASSQFSNDHLQLDAWINVLSMITTFMVAHKVLENWIYWFFINLAATYLYWQTGLVLSSLLFFGYVVFSIYGFLTWRREWKSQNGTALDHHTA